jgi:hypothetical protein
LRNLSSKKNSTRSAFYGNGLGKRITMKQGALTKIFFLLIIIGLFSSSCSSLLQKPAVNPPIFREDFSALDPDDFPEKIKQLEDIARNHENNSVRTRAHLYIALAHIHYKNPLPDYSLAFKHLDEYIVLNPDDERINEILIWKSVLDNLESSIRNYEELKKNYDVLKQENVRANKDWKYLYQQKEELTKTVEEQKKLIMSLEANIKKLNSLYLEIEKKKKIKKKNS